MDNDGNSYESLARIESLMACLVQVLARRAISLDEIRGVVGSKSSYVRAYNLLNGRRSLTEVAKKARIDTGNLSKAVARWIQGGVAFKLGSERDAPALHVYPIPVPTKVKKKP